MNGLGFGRRLELRADVRAVASVSLCGHVWIGPFSVENLSVGGALIRGHSRLDAGNHVQMQLHLPGCDAISLDARVLRICDKREGEQRLAIKFAAPEREVEDTIRRIVVRSLERSRLLGSAVLVVERVRHDREALAADLRRLGRRPVVASTPLELVHRLQDHHCLVTLALIDMNSPELSGLDVLQFMVQEFPSVRRVIVGGDRAQLERIRTKAHAHALMVKPWKRDELGRLIAGVEDWRETFAARSEASVDQT